jgi:hypothetical protein
MVVGGSHRSQISLPTTWKVQKRRKIIQFPTLIAFKIAKNAVFLL